MSYEQGTGILGALGDRVAIPIPQDGKQYHAVVELEELASWTGDAEVHADGSEVLAVVIGTDAATEATPAASGNYAIDCGSGALEVAVVVGAYTAGTLRARIVLIPQG